MTVVLDQRAPQKAEEAFRRQGFSVLRLPPHPALAPPVASHPDMLLFFSPEEILCTRAYAAVARQELEVLSRACGRPVRAVEAECGREYPHDILLNTATVGKTRFCLPDFTAREIPEDTRFSVCAVKQGYAKCSTLPVGERALITADPSIARAARAEGLDVLQISSGEVELTGYDTGFLGGAASFAPYGRYDKIYFCGSLERHSMGDAIRLFCLSHGYEPISLFDGPLTDVGTMFLVEST